VQAPSLSIPLIKSELQLTAFVRLFARITTNVRGPVTQWHTGTIRLTVVCHVHLVALGDVVMQQTVMFVLATAIRRAALATHLMSASILLSMSVVSHHYSVSIQMFLYLTVMHKPIVW